jgi:hypothetical protein
LRRPKIRPRGGLRRQSTSFERMPMVRASCQTIQLIVQGLRAVFCVQPTGGGIQRYSLDQPSRRLDVPAAERTSPRLSPAAGRRFRVRGVRWRHSPTAARRHVRTSACDVRTRTLRSNRPSPRQTCPGGQSLLRGMFSPQILRDTDLPKCAGLPFLSTNSRQGADISVFNRSDSNRHRELHRPEISPE